jgi:superfamily II DNA/RNA helicase
MGREGVAFTFVAPEEGGELTRIEARIDKQLKRSEMSDMQLVNEKYTPLTETGEPAKPPPVPGKRAKRYRRGL